jgi:hypothetical protein
MKTITVTDEVYEFLKSCQEELNTQNNRHTAMPIFGFIFDKEVASHDPQEYVFINDDHTDTITKTEHEDWQKDLAEYIMNRFDEINDIRQFLSDTFTDIAWPVYHQYTDDEQFEEAIKNDLIQYIKNLEYYDYSNFADEVNINVYGYETIPVMYEESVSLFESDMEAHLNMNKHNMPEVVRTYVYSNYRTPKMEQLRNVLMKEIKFEGN